MKELLVLAERWRIHYKHSQATLLVGIQPSLSLRYTNSSLVQNIRQSSIVDVPYYSPPLSCDLLTAYSWEHHNALYEVIARLASRALPTNIKPSGGGQHRDSFGLIDASSNRRNNGPGGRLQWVETKLSDWVFIAIWCQEVLSLHPDYFPISGSAGRLKDDFTNCLRKHCRRNQSEMLTA